MTSSFGLRLPKCGYHQSPLKSRTVLQSKDHTFLYKLDFLGHHISQCGIEVSSSKARCILNWSILKSATDAQKEFSSTSNPETVTAAGR
jgi:hypothetical protein